ncbi:hypothetical protein [Bacillus mycoides]|nr:hypothetical protein [Bacillus mycoides]
MVNHGLYIDDNHDMGDGLYIGHDNGDGGDSDSHNMGDGLYIGHDYGDTY